MFKTHSFLRILPLGLVLGVGPATSHAASNVADIMGGVMDQMDRQTGLQRLEEKIAQDRDQPLTLLEAQKKKQPEELGKDFPTFELKRVNLKGNKSIGTDLLKGHWEKFLGQQISLREAQEIADGITQTYREKGYALSFARVPQQAIEKGSVTITVVEGYIDQVIVAFEDKKSKVGTTLSKLIDKIQGEKPLLKAAYERYMLLIRDLYPNAKGYLKASEDNNDGAGTLRVVIPKPKDQGVSVGVNNYMSDSVGPWMMAVTLDRPAPWNSEHQLELRYSQGTYRSELWSEGFGYAFPINGEGTRVGIDVDTVRSRPGGRIKDFDAVTKEDEASVFIMHPFKRSQQLNIYGNLEFEMVNQTRYIRLVDDVKKERSRKVKATLIAQWQDSLRGSNYVNLSGIQGLRMLNSVDMSYEDRTRLRGSAHNLYMRADLRRTQHIKGPFTLGLEFMGQYANSTLLDIDRFRTRGFPFSGAYTPAALSGDSGLESKVELAYTKDELTKIRFLKLFTYFTKVKVWNRHPNAGEQFGEVANGLGCGVQVVLHNNLQATLQYGYPLNGPVGNDSANPQVGFGLNWRF